MQYKEMKITSLLLHYILLFTSAQNKEAGLFWGGDGVLKVIGKDFPLNLQKQSLSHSQAPQV